MRLIERLLAPVLNYAGDCFADAYGEVIHLPAEAIQRRRATETRPGGGAAVAARTLVHDIAHRRSPST